MNGDLSSNTGMGSKEIRLDPRDVLDSRRKEEVRASCQESA